MATSKFDIKAFLVKWKAKRYQVMFLEDVSDKDLETLYSKLSDAYYNEDPLVTDKVFDAAEMFIKTRIPKSSIFKSKVRHEVAPNRKKLPLSGWMSSLDKVYPHLSNIAVWAEKNKSPTYVIADKLDGFSLEADFDHSGKIVLKSGGDGHQGQDLSHLVPHLNLPSKVTNMVVRFEGITKKGVHSKFKSVFKNSRNMLSNVFNSDNPHGDLLKHVELVALEVISPKGLPLAAQYEKLKAAGFTVPAHKVIPFRSLSNESVSDMLDRRKGKSKYLIDGLVITSNKSYVRPTKGNPKYAIAFKVNSEDNKVTSTVIKVEGNISRTGRIVPLVWFEPVELQGVTIQKATGHNYGYIHANSIGPGSVIQITRSGEVIPYIEKVIKKSRKPQMPDGVEGEDWIWTTDTDIGVYNGGEDSARIIAVKNLAHFASVMGIEGLKEGLASKLYDEGIDTFFKLITLTPSKIAKMEGIGDITGRNLYDQINTSRYGGVTLPAVSAATSVFGSGIGYSRIESLMEQLDLNKLSTKPLAERRSLIMGCRGFSQATADPIARKLPSLFTFINKAGIVIVNKESVAVQSTKMVGKTIIFSGFRSSQLEDWIIRNGGTMGKSIRSSNLLIVKDIDGGSSKIKEAKALGIDTVQASDFVKNVVKNVVKNEVAL